MTQHGPTRHSHGAWHGVALPTAGLVEAIGAWRAIHHRGGLAGAIVPAASAALVDALPVRRAHRRGIA